MKAAAPIATVTCLVLALTWFSFRAVNPEAELFDHALAKVDRFAMTENALYRDVFAARAGMLRNYDLLADGITALRDTLQRLRELAANDAETTAAIDRLSPEQFAVIRLSFIEERSHPEIAAMLGIPLGTVKSRIRLAMLRLRELLDEQT